MTTMSEYDRRLKEMNAKEDESSQGSRIRGKSQNKIDTTKKDWPTPPNLKYPLVSPTRESARLRAWQEDGESLIRAWEGDGDGVAGDGVESSVTQSVGAESRAAMDTEGAKAEPEPDVPDDASMITVPESQETIELRARRKERMLEQWMMNQGKK